MTIKWEDIQWFQIIHTTHTTDAIFLDFDVMRWFTLTSICGCITEGVFNYFAARGNAVITNVKPFVGIWKKKNTLITITKYKRLTRLFWNKKLSIWNLYILVWASFYTLCSILKKFLSIFNAKSLYGIKSLWCILHRK